eukprot:TRINITY_DN358_c0_g1_i12.p1 TRINITY_DN358_c0_g1~~TRINITY_DN358_c0_g1_i12.p1  ORF type:complete len:288 (+),score=21.49 TRINITY_DN358_c0_g1_i12:82-864(+)
MSYQPLEPLEEDTGLLDSRRKTTFLPSVGSIRELTGNWTQTLRELFAEWMGTMFFVYIGTGSVLATVPWDGLLDPPTIVAVSMGFGFGLATMVYATANVSGGHLNPAVTIAIVFAKKMSLIKGFFYICSQCLGAIVGSAMIMATIPKPICEAAKYGATTLATNTTFGKFDQHSVAVSLGHGFFMEMLLTFLLVFTVFATASLPGEEKQMGKFAPLSIGFAVLSCHLVGIPYTGPSMNPARSFGPAVISGVWTHHWVYWVK